MIHNRIPILFRRLLGLLLLSTLVTSNVVAAIPGSKQSEPVSAFLLDQTLVTQPPQPPNTNGSDPQSLPQDGTAASATPDDNRGGQPVPSQTIKPSIQPPNVDDSKAQTRPATSEQLTDRNTGIVVQAITPQAISSVQSTDSSEEASFPTNEDEIGLIDNPYWWQTGDYAQGTRTLAINSISAARISLVIEENALNTTGHVDLDLSINGTVVGSVSVLPGDTVVTAAFFFAPISSPNYVIRLEETNTVDPGAGSIIISLNTSSITFYDSTTSLFPGTGDTFGIDTDPYWWQVGDYAEGVRTVGLPSVYGIRYELFILDNALNTTGHVDLDLSINGTVVGSFTILPGEMTKTGIFFFSPTDGPIYTIRLEETNTVDPGAGSVSFDLDTSTISFYGSASSRFPATGDDVTVGTGTYWWLEGDYAQGTRTPGLDTVTGIQFELMIDENALITTGHVDLDLSVNGTVVGSFSILPGETSRTVAFFFAPISGPVYTVRLEATNTVDPGMGSISILLDTSAITFYDSTRSQYLPATGDMLSVANYPYWWNVGDYAEGTRITHLETITGIQYELILSTNRLNTTGHVDLDLSINGLVVTSLTVLPGEMSKSGTATFAPISGPIYVIRLEETNLVDPGTGSIVIPLDRSMFQFTTSIFLPELKK